MKFFNLKKNNRGYGLVELIFYVAIFSITSVLVLNSILTMVNAFKETSANNHLVQASKILERISREIRNAEIYSIDGNSITLTDTDATSVNFTFSNNDILLYESGTLLGPLNPANVRITSMSFSPVVSVRNGATYDAGNVDPLGSSAVKVAITMQSNRFGLIKEKTFYTTIVLRESY